MLVKEKMKKLKKIKKPLPIITKKDFIKALKKASKKGSKKPSHEKEMKRTSE